MSSGTITKDSFDTSGTPTVVVKRARRGSIWSMPSVGVAALLFIFALVTLVLFQRLMGIHPFGVSNAQHYLYQADAFLHGRWDVTLPAALHDTIIVHGKVYMVYPPFPALVMLPFVAMFGMHASDIFITTVIASLNLSLIYLLLEQLRVVGLTRRSHLDNFLMSVMLFFGSINLFLSLGGRVWFTAQVIGLACTLLALLLAFQRHFALSALLMGFAFFCRGTLALGFPLILYLAWENGGAEAHLTQFVRSIWRHKIEWPSVPWSRVIPPLVIMCIVVALFLMRNLFVFGSALESGYGIANQQNYPQIIHGAYSLYYLPRNLVASFFDFPRVSFASPFALRPHVDMIGDGMGMSVFVTTPIFLYLFARNEKFSPLRLALQITVAICVAQALLFCATGYFQFGERYLFDAYPFAFVLLSLNERRIDWRFIALGIAGIMISGYGAHQFWTIS